MKNWNVVRAEGLLEAHHEIEYAFHQQLRWWSYIPFVGIIAIFRRNKLLRIGQYLCDQLNELPYDE